MLIRGAAEGEEGRAVRGTAADAEYQTADELFELMAKNQSYDINDHQSLSTGDLVILYKNIDVGTKLMSDANDLQRKSPNQHVETVIYKDEKESDDSDVSEICSNEDLREMCLINNERIDLMNMYSVQHSVCHKFGNIEIQSSKSTDYNRQFLFKDPYIKQQLKNINVMPEYKGIGAVLPASLLDYICCRRLEDNYNFYMDNIIRYVQHTIEQLKRISNGDYLTDRAKEKWREVVKDRKISTPDDAKVLSTSVSIPLHVEGKVNGHRRTWDDIIHSEVDVRSLSKILEKKIIIEIPKLICGSYRLFSKRHADNLIISCKKELNYDNSDDRQEESRVDVVLQLKRSESGHVISNINSIMILQKISSLTRAEPKAIEYDKMKYSNENDSIHENAEPVIKDEHCSEELLSDISMIDGNTTVNINTDDNTTTELVFEKDCLDNNADSHQFSVVDNRQLNRNASMKLPKTETDFTVLTPDELRCTIQRLNMQEPVPEESEEICLNKKKSPTRVRIKSPYENKFFFMEEKKRKKLLEIREKREKRKLALSENCKVTKHKYGKGAVMAQPSSSMTKLSITNKSFYNSIYGESLNHDVGISKKLRKWQMKREDDTRQDESENVVPSVMTLNKSSFDDDNPETIMELQVNISSTEKQSTLTDAALNYSLNGLSQLTASSGTDYSICDGESSLFQESQNENKLSIDEDDDVNDLVMPLWSCNIVPANTPKVPKKCDEDIKTAPTPVDCRKSIDKIYDLMKKLEMVEESDITDSTGQCTKISDTFNTVDDCRSSTIQISDSGTSVKHHVVSSNPSSLSFDKNNNHSKQEKKKDVPAAIVPKVIISSKSSKVDTEGSKTDRKRNVNSPLHKVPENPLKAISQLLHEFDNVQKIRHKSQRKVDNDDGKPISRQGSSKKHRQEQIKDNIPTPARLLSFKEKRTRTGQVTDTDQQANYATHTDVRHISKTVKKISDIIDEAKEARGEAVRGPSKLNSRLNTLAQPKKSYIQAHNDDQIKSGRNISAHIHRVQRSTTSTPNVEKNAAVTNLRNKRKGSETASPSPKTANYSVPSTEKTTKPRRSASNSPSRKRFLQPTAATFSRQNNVPETPENLKKKMVAVASYVKSHFGPIDTSQLIGNDAHKSRVPLVPNDIELASMTSSPIAEESTALGKKLHYMIDTMINTNAPCLSTLPECIESTSKLSNDGLEKLSLDSLSKIEEPKSESDYPVDIFGDKNIVTAVENISKTKIHKNVVSNKDAIDTVACNVQPFNSATELRILENALYQKISVGAFPKRLRIKNLTLTPKQSLQQVIVVQSGDAGSLQVKSSQSQSLRTSEPKTGPLTAIKPLTALSNTHINWGFNIPLQVATVGYAFPTYTSVHNNSISTSVKRGHEHVEELKSATFSEDVKKNSFKSHKTSQCFKGVHTEPCFEQSTQANFVRVPSVCNIRNVKVESVETINEKSDESKDIALCLQIPSDDTKDNSDDKEATNKEPQNVDHTTSLGILMGLLNEIRKITGETDNGLENIDNEKLSHCPHQEIEVILNNAATQESSVSNNCRDIVSVSSLDKLKQLGSSHSIYSIKLLKNKNHDRKENKNVGKNVFIIDKPQIMDKEVSVSIEKQYVNRITDTPSCFFTTLIDNNTNVTESVFRIINKPSTQSVYSIAKYETFYSNTSFDKISERPKINKTSLFICENPINSDYSNNKNKTFLHNLCTFAKEKSMPVIDNSFKYACKIYKNATNTYYAMEPEIDRRKKLKRDVLVTAYTILVFTVFAALSFSHFF